MLERDLDPRLGGEEVALVNGLALLPADGLDLVPDLAGEQKLASHEGGNVHPAHVDQVAGEVPQPSDQLTLANVRLACLPVEP